MLTISRLSKTYANGVRALDDVSLTIGSGLYGLLGLCWATGVDAKSRLEQLADFCDRNGLRDEARAAREALGMLDGSARRP